LSVNTRLSLLIRDLCEVLLDACFGTLNLLARDREHITASSRIWLAVLDQGQRVLNPDRK